MIVRYAADPDIMGECEFVHALYTRKVFIWFQDVDDTYLEDACEWEVQLGTEWKNLLDSMNCGRLVVLESGRIVAKLQAKDTNFENISTRGGS
jgi:hypothetical protein